MLNKANEMGLTVIVESEGLDPCGVDEVERCIRYLKGNFSINMKPVNGVDKAGLQGKPDFVFDSLADVDKMLFA